MIVNRRRHALIPHVRRESGGRIVTEPSDGRRVLIRCHSGYDRSGLVVAQALTIMGHSTDDAIFLIRYRRSKWAPNNPLFVDHLNAGLDVARLLTELDA